MNVYNLWDSRQKELKLKSSLSSDWSYTSPVATPRSVSPPAKFGESIFNKYIELIKSKSNISTKAKQIESPDRPFDFYDDEEFAFGINLLKNNVSCVGDNMTKLIQMAHPQQLYKANVRPHMEYCPHCWAVAPEYQLLSFDHQRKAARILNDRTLSDRFDPLGLR